MIQHPKMAELCPTSVNTIRIATLLGDKKQGIVYAFPAHWQRQGDGQRGSGRHGGAHRLWKAATLLTVGADKQGNTYTEHPMTHTPIVGLPDSLFQGSLATCA